MSPCRSRKKKQTHDVPKSRLIWSSWKAEKWLDDYCLLVVTRGKVLGNTLSLIARTRSNSGNHQSITDQKHPAERLSARLTKVCIYSSNRASARIQWYLIGKHQTSNSEYLFISFFFSLASKQCVFLSFPFLLLDLTTECTRERKESHNSM